MTIGVPAKRPARYRFQSAHPPAQRCGHCVPVGELTSATTEKNETQKTTKFHKIDFLREYIMFFRARRGSVGAGRLVVPEIFRKKGNFVEFVFCCLFFSCWVLLFAPVSEVCSSTLTGFFGRGQKKSEGLSKTFLINLFI